jgi:hypothetical protein
MCFAPGSSDSISSLHVIEQRHDHVGVVDGDDRLGPDRLQTGKGGIPGEYAYAVALLSELPLVRLARSPDGERGKQDQQETQH